MLLSLSQDTSRNHYVRRTFIPAEPDNGFSIILADGSEAKMNNIYIKEEKG
ncbi:hypothetical protein AwEntero_12400 [Enterobacterales bacterium]|nr:hypothetical protein AwEntero_12400 [Enterobacterales bacterium]